jgi:hypothetical protein
MVLKRIIPEGEVLPFMYGIAWTDIYSRRMVAYPIPLNFIIGFLREIYWRLQCGMRRTKFQAMIDESAKMHYRRGYEEGFRDRGEP